MGIENASWDFHRYWIWAVLALMVGCAGCSLFGGRDLTDEEYIKVITKAGCNLKTIERKEGKVGDVSCSENQRVIHER